jgi:hypothetical protein
MEADVAGYFKFLVRPQGATQAVNRRRNKQVSAKYSIHQKLTGFELLPFSKLFVALTHLKPNF